MTGFQLKLLAMATMAVDHIGAAFFPEVIAFRVVGRISMPIFAFLVAEGCRHTSNWKKYCGRLVLFGLISEIPFNLYFYGSISAFYHQNMMFTLALGVLAVALYERHRNGGGAVWGLGVAIIGGILMVDYGMYGVLLVFTFYLWGQRVWGYAMVLAALTLLIQPLGLQTVAILAILPISLYNGERGKDMRWLFYGFYPSHLLILWGLQMAQFHGLF